MSSEAAFLNSKEVKRDGGVLLSETENLQKELGKRKICGSTWQGFQGASTSSVYWRLLRCYRWFCGRCGRDKGPIHKRRVFDVIRNLGGRSSLKDWAGYEFVFTVPGSEREKFRTRHSINALQGMALRCVRKFFPGRYEIVFFHGFGDKEPGVYKPHVPILILERKTGRLMKLSKETVENIKADYKNRLIKYGCHFEGPVVVEVNFFVSTPQLYHRIKYNCRLHPAPRDLEGILSDEVLRELFISGEKSMKGFPYVKYCGEFRKKKGEKKNFKDENISAHEMGEHEKKAGEKLLWIGPDAYLTNGEFRLRYRSWDYEIVNDGLIRVKNEVVDRFGKITKRRC